MGLELGVSPYRENGFGGTGRHDGYRDSRRWVSVCAVEPHGLCCASNVGWVKWTGVRLAGHVALMARTH